jgi:hypothetical protein
MINWNALEFSRGFLETEDLFNHVKYKIETRWIFRQKIDCLDNYLVAILSGIEGNEMRKAFND